MQSVQEGTFVELLVEQSDELEPGVLTVYPAGTRGEVVAAGPDSCMVMFENSTCECSYSALKMCDVRQTG
jgi:hypothetical protein